MCTTGILHCFGNLGRCKTDNCPHYKKCAIRTMEIDMKLEVRG